MILGSATVLDGLVYFSTTARTTTYALNAQSGKKVLCGAALRVERAAARAQMREASG